LEAFTESPIYARTNGYLARWYRDIGSRVPKGQLLADIDTPEVDQELMQAHAAKDQAEAQLNLAKTSADRWEALRKMDAVAQQEVDEKQAAFAAREVEFYSTRTINDLQALVSQSWNCNDSCTYQIARSYLALMGHSPVSQRMPLSGVL